MLTTASVISNWAIRGDKVSIHGAARAVLLSSTLCWPIQKRFSPTQALTMNKPLIPLEWGVTPTCSRKGQCQNPDTHSSRRRDVGELVGGNHRDNRFLQRYPIQFYTNQLIKYPNSRNRFLNLANWSSAIKIRKPSAFTTIVFSTASCANRRISGPSLAGIK